MFLEQRQSGIMDLLNVGGSVSLGELMRTFDVSEATVRRDLNELEKLGLLRRTHGGAVRVSELLFEREYKEEKEVNAKEKESIARVVASLVDDSDTIILDSGTTTEQIACALADRDITIITNSATIPSESNMGEFRPVLYKAGGLYRVITKSIVGSEAERFIRSFRPAKAFIATNGISGEEVTTPHTNESGIKKVMMEVAKQNYLVADHTKFGREYLSVVANVKQFAAIITDDGIAPETLSFYRSKATRVITERTFCPENANA